MKKDSPPVIERIRAGKQEVPELKHFVDSRDYQGAISYLQVSRNGRSLIPMIFHSSSFDLKNDMIQRMNCGWDTAISNQENILLHEE